MNKNFATYYKLKNLKWDRPLPFRAGIKSGTKTLRELGIHEYDIAFITSKLCGCELKQCKDANQQELDQD